MYNKKAASRFAGITKHFIAQKREIPNYMMQSPLISPSTPSLASPGPAPRPVNIVELECKKICVIRCLHAVTCNVAMQFLLLALFLLFVNFSIWHPITWIVQTFRLILSIYTWLYITPLISVVIIYGIYLGKSYLREKKMYRTRFMIMYKMTLPKCLFFTLHFLVGLLTTWLYSRFLSEDYHSLFLSRSECSTDDYKLNSSQICVNEKNLIISLYGSLVALWYCWKKDPSNESCEFPIIHQSKYLRVRSFLYSVLWTTLIQVFVPVVVSHVFYSLIGRLPFQWFLNRWFSVEFVFSGNVHVYDVKLLVIIWILSTHILSNLHLMAFLFQVFLTQPKVFPIEGRLSDTVFNKQQIAEVTLVQALANSKIPIVRQLAALDLYTLSEYGDLYKRRQQIFALSLPGGHPYNWNALSSQCMSLINEFNSELRSAVNNLKNGPQIKLNNNALPNQMKYIHTFQSNLPAPVSEFRSSTPTSATEMAEKIRNRQYNESCGIRNMLTSIPPVENEQLLSPIKPVSDPCVRFNHTLFILQEKIQNVRTAIFNMPGIRFLFGENEMAQLQALLTISKADEMAWIVQGLSSIAVHSIHEDRYGVVQMNLPEIITTLLQLRESINQLPPSLFNVNTISPYLRSFQSKPSGAILLRNAIKRSLYNICITFNEYLPDLVTNSNDLRILQHYIDFLEA